MKRDATDLEEISAKLVAWSPFSPDSSLKNVVTGVVADEGVNVHEYKSVGCKIMQKMIGQPAFTFSFSRKDKAITLGQTSAIKVAPDRTIDSALLFQRFLVVSQTGELSLEEVMRYELTPFPPALFEARNVFRKADKPQLAKAICDHAQDAIQDSVPETEYHDIVKAAVEASRLHTTTLIGEDTDLLVLLLYYAQGDTMALYFKSDRSKPDGSFKVYDINYL